MKKHFKSLITVLLCLSILPGTALSASAGDDTLRITVATDTHFSSFSDLGEFPSDYTQVTNIDGMLDKDVYYYTSIQGQMDWESKAILKQLLSAFAESDDEFLLLAGDLTSGDRQSHYELAEILRNVEADTGKEIFVTSGNHDVEDGVSTDEFMQIYADFGYADALSVHQPSGSYTADLSGKYRLIVIDSSETGDVGGEITPAALDWVRQQAAAAQNDGKTLIAMMHHSLLPHFAVEPMINSSSHAALVEELAGLGINVFFTGHIHANDISSVKTRSGKTVYDVMTGSLTVYPHAYRHASFSDSGIEISTDYITEIDTADLTQGYNAEQLSRIEENFPAYSYGFFEAGMCRWLNAYAGDGAKVGRKLGFEQDSIAFKLLDHTLTLAGNAINTPIYDDGSTPDVIDTVEELAKLKGFEIPESDYRMPYQVVAAIMSNFYCGDETDVSFEVELVYNCLKSLVPRFAETLIFEGTINCLLGSLDIAIAPGILTSGLELGIEDMAIIDTIAVSILNSLLKGIANDYSQPGDLNVELNTSTGTAGLTLFERILRMFIDLFSSFKRLFEFI